MKKETLKTDELLLLKHRAEALLHFHLFGCRLGVRAHIRYGGKHILALVNYNFMRDKIVMIIH